MSTEALRDVVVSIAVMLWSLLVIVIAAIFFFAQRYTGRGFAALDRLFAKRLRPALAKTEAQLQQVRNIAGNLPGGVPVLEGGATPSVRSRRALPFGRRRRRLALPFRKKRRLPLPFVR